MGEVIHDKMEYSLSPKQSSNSAAAQGQTFTASNLITGSGKHGNGASISGISITPSTITIDANPSSSSTREIKRTVSQVHNAYGIGYTGASCELVFSQGRDYVSSMTLTLGTPSVIAAGGGSVNSCSYTLTVNWASGKQQTYSSIIPNGASINWTGVTADSKGTRISNQTTAGTLRCTVSFDGKTARDSATVYQSGNYVTSIDLTGFAIAYSKSVSAAGGTVSPTVTNGTVKYYYSSGSNGTATPASTYGSLTSAIIYSGSTANGFSAPNATTGAMTASDRGTVTGSARNSGTVTATKTVTWTPSGSYNSLGVKSDSMSDSDYATQVANSVISSSRVYDAPTFSLESSYTFGEDGGSYTISPSNGRQTYTDTYTSGSHSTGSTTLSGTYSYTTQTAAEGFSRSNNIVIATKNTVTTARGGFVVRVTLTANGKSSYKDITFSQAAYEPEPVVLNNITATAVWATDVPASGGTATSANCIFAITAYYSDGSTQIIPASQCSISGSMDVNPSTDGERHSVGNITFNVSYEGKSTTCSATVYQAAYQAVFNGDVVITYWAFSTAGTSEEVTLFYTGGSQIVGFKVDDDDTIYDSSTTSMTFDTNVFHTVTYEFKDGIIDWRTFMYCDRILDAEIGESINTIKGYAFFGCGFLTAATLPDTLVELGGSMFGQTAIKNPVIPDSVTQMGTDVFRSCENIDTCTIGSGLTEIPKSTFYLSNISAITIPSNIETIGYSAFSYCTDLQSVEFEEGCQVISGYAFQNTDKLVNIEFPNSLREIGSRAFEGSGLKYVAIPIYVEEIGSNAFANCDSLTGVSIGAKIVGEAAFFWCTGLTSVAMNNGVEEIGSSCFTNCSNLNSISLPSTIKSIGKWAFSSLPYGFSLTCMASTPPAAADEFIDISNWQGWIYVPSGSVTAYKTASGWSNYADRIIAA